MTVAQQVAAIEWLLRRLAAHALRNDEMETLRPPLLAVLETLRMWSFMQSVLG